MIPRLLLAVGLLAPALASAQEARGFAEVRLSLFPGASGKPWQLVERVRPSFEAELHDRVKLSATVEAGLAQGRSNEEELNAALTRAGLPAAAPSPANRLLRIDGVDDYLEVDRLHVDYYGERFDLRVGRQAINWGSAQFFNPTDPFPEVLLTEPWRPRRGVNAARLNVPFGERVDLSSVLAINDPLDELRAAARLRVNVGKTDLALAAAWRGENNNALIGVDLRGTLVVGWWIEAAWLFGISPHEEVSVGLDYSFAILERATVFAQYYRNGAGTLNPAVAVTRRLALGSASVGARPDPFAPFVQGQNYGLLGASLGILPELSTALSALQNLDDGSGVAILTLSWAALDWLELAASAQVPYALWGRGGELKPRASDLRFTVPIGGGAQRAEVDLSGLAPAATLILWTRASF